MITTRSRVSSHSQPLGQNPRELRARMRTSVTSLTASITITILFSCCVHWVLYRSRLYQRSVFFFSFLFPINFLSYHSQLSILMKSDTRYFDCLLDVFFASPTIFIVVGKKVSKLHPLISFPRLSMNQATPTIFFPTPFIFYLQQRMS